MSGTTCHCTFAVSPPVRTATAGRAFRTVAVYVWGEAQARRERSRERSKVLGCKICRTTNLNIWLTCEVLTNLCGDEVCRHRTDSGRAGWATDRRNNVLWPRSHLGRAGEPSCRWLDPDKLPRWCGGDPHPQESFYVHELPAMPMRWRPSACIVAGALALQQRIININHANCNS